MYKISWNEFETLSFKLMKKIAYSKKDIDIIVCVSRGGLLLGRILSEELNIPLGIISAKFLNGEYIVDNCISSLHKISGNVLLVDDIFEQTSIKIIKNIKKNYKDVKNIYLACVFYKSSTDFAPPDYYINKIKDKFWVLFPYQQETKSLKYINKSIKN